MAGSGAATCNYFLQQHASTLHHLTSQTKQRAATPQNPKRSRGITDFEGGRSLERKWISLGRARSALRNQPQSHVGHERGGRRWLSPDISTGSAIVRTCLVLLTDELLDSRALTHSSKFSRQTKITEWCVKTSSIKLNNSLKKKKVKFSKYLRVVDKIKHLWMSSWALGNTDWHFIDPATN